MTQLTPDYTLEKAIAFYRHHVKQKHINANTGNAKCAALNTLVKNTILTPSEFRDIRTINLADLKERMTVHLTKMTPNSQCTYIGRAKLAIRDYIRNMDRMVACQ